MLSPEIGWPEDPITNLDSSLTKSLPPFEEAPSYNLKEDQFFNGISDVEWDWRRRNHNSQK